MQIILPCKGGFFTDKRFQVKIKQRTGEESERVMNSAQMGFAQKLKLATNEHEKTRIIEIISCKFVFIRG